MLSEEEKKAIEILNTFELRRKTINYKEISLEDTQSVKIVLNLIEKQQKEIEELNELLKSKTMRISFENIDNYISKDKIREFMKEQEYKLRI